MLQQLHEIINNLAGRKIAVLGDYMLDTYIWGSCSRISPEAPVPVVEVEREDTVPGGAGNVVRNLAALGVSPLACGIIGEDQAGYTLAGHLRDMGADLTPLVRTPERKTTTKIRVIAAGQQVVRVDYDYKVEPVEGLYDSLVGSAIQAIEEVDALILSDYDKGTLTEGVSRHLLSHAREIGLTVCVDPKPYHMPYFFGATLISPNEREATIATGINISSDESAVAAARKLQADAQLEAAVITRGGKGMCVYEATGAVHLLPAVPTEVFDVTGAGDTSISVLAACLASGASFLQAAVIANTAGGEVVRHIGCATVTAEQLHQAIDEKAAVIEEIQTRNTNDN